MGLYFLHEITLESKTNSLEEVEGVYFLGIHLAKKGHKLYDLEMQEVFFSLDVKFCEEKFSFKKETTNCEVNLGAK